MQVYCPARWQIGDVAQKRIDQHCPMALLTMLTQHSYRDTVDQWHACACVLIPDPTLVKGFGTLSNSSEFWEASHVMWRE